uniref:Ionotropic glutamate receptor C-terminal domain-containing protein n=1 Tax=Oryza punctata TaxID=4537 RepID=A0A0E0L8T9_ORYPU
MMNLDLIKTVQVRAIIAAPQTSAEADFMAHLGNHNRIPILSFSGISPTSEQPHTMPYFVQTAANDLLQAKPIVSIVMYFSWPEVVLVCEDSAYGTGILPRLTAELEGKDSRISEVVFVPVDATDRHLIKVMDRLKHMETRVFIVHMRSSLAARIFVMANGARMMSKGYAWIATSSFGNAVDSLRSHAINSMEGVVTLRPSFNETDHVKRFFAKFQQRISSYDDHFHNDPSMLLLWSYDAGWAIATAAEKARLSSLASTSRPQHELPITGDMLLVSVLKTTFDGLAGTFMLDNKGYQQRPLSYDILNVIGKGTRTVGTWTQEHPSLIFSKNIIWPGDSTNVPKGPSRKDLLIAVPVKHGFQEFVNVSSNKITGCCIDLFDRVMRELKYEGKYKYVRDGDSEDSNHLVQKVHKKQFDVLVGDITITAKRMENVMFTVPFTEIGWTMMVVAKKDTGKRMWIFEKPFTKTLWLASFVLCCFTGFVVWVIEHRINLEFRGTPWEQFGTTFYFIFSTMTMGAVRHYLLLHLFDHEEKLQSNMTRMVVIVWVFFMLILTSSYTANLSSMLTVPCGVSKNSFVKDSLIDMGFDDSNLHSLSTVEQYNQALSNGSVKAIFDEIPYLKLVQSRFPDKYTMADPIYKTGGFAFVFQEGSPLGRRVSEILMMMLESPSKNNTIDFIAKTCLGDRTSVNKKDIGDMPRLDFNDFSGLILISTSVSGLMLLIHLAMFVYKEFPELRAAVPGESGWASLQWVRALFRHFDSRDPKSHNFRVQQQDGIMMNERERGNRVLEGDGDQEAAMDTGGGSTTSGRSNQVEIMATNSQSLQGQTLTIHPFMSAACVSMALDDYYYAAQAHDADGNATAHVELVVRDSRGDVVVAADAANDLITNDQVQAIIIGSHTSAEAEFIAYLGNHTHTPILSFAGTSAPLVPFFLHTAPSDSIQVAPIAAILNVFNWRAAVVLHQNSPYGDSILPDLVYATQGYNIRIIDRVALPIDVTQDYLNNVLQNLKEMPIRVFIVHMLLDLAARVFHQANVAGMMSDGYVWIATTSIGNVVDSLSPDMIDNMQGVVTLRPYVCATGHVMKFISRLKARFWRENRSIDDVHNPSVPLLWAYDTAWALSTAVNLAKVTSSTPGTTLLSALLNTTFDGLAGRFRLVNGQLQLSEYEIVNIIGKGARIVGFWTPESGFCKNLKTESQKGLKQIIWSGDLAIAPKGWDMSSNGQLLRVAVPSKHGFPQIVEVSYSPTTNSSVVKGYCIDVFDTLMKNLHYPVAYQYEPIGNSLGNYDNLLSLVHEKKVDAMVGDTTITVSRMNKVSFTMPFTEVGLSMVVAVKKETNWSMWIFLRPLSTTLWIASLAFFFFTGFVVWVLEHRINHEFRGTRWQQFGVTFYFAFSTLVFSHKEKLESNLSRFAVIIWVFVVLILTSSYTASLTSMLTVQQLQPAATNVQDLLRNGNYVGYQKGSTVVQWLEEMGFQKENLRGYASLEEYDDALQRGSENGGVVAVFDEIPYLKAFLSKYCQGYTMVGPTYRLGGFGFAFPIGSPIVHDLWQAFMLPSVQEEMARIDRKWFGDTQTCDSKSSGVGSSSSSLSFSNFSGLFLISGITSSLAPLVHLAILAYQERDELRATFFGIIRALAPRLHPLLRCLRPEQEVDVLHREDTVSL